MTKIKVDGALLNSASTKKAINPEQVVRLVRDQVKMSETGSVEVIDSKTGQTRYSDTGEALSVDGLVDEFLKSKKGLKIQKLNHHKVPSYIVVP